MLTVGYIGNKAWVQIDDGEYSAPEPDKYMKITLRERSGGMYVSSIQSADGQEVIGTAPPTQAVPATAPPVSAPPETNEAVTAEPMTDENGEPVTEEEQTSDEAASEDEEYSGEEV